MATKRRAKADPVLYIDDCLGLTGELHRVDIDEVFCAEYVRRVSDDGPQHIRQVLRRLNGVRLDDEVDDHTTESVTATRATFTVT